jgi:hypothetical protein
VSPPPLRKCPTCSGPVTEEMGLRNYATWLQGLLPGKVGASDLDMVIEQTDTGRVLITEFKEHGSPVSLGQRLLLRRFVRMGCDVWVIHSLGGDNYAAGAMNSAGRTPFVQGMPLDELKQRVLDWWQTGKEDD